MNYNCDTLIEDLSIRLCRRGIGVRDDRLSHLNQQVSCCIERKSSCLFAIQSREPCSSSHHSHASMMKVAHALAGQLHELPGRYHSGTLLLVFHSPSKRVWVALLFLINEDEGCGCERIIVCCNRQCLLNRCTCMECAYCIR